MKKKHLFFVLLLALLPIVGWAEPVDVETARQKAADFLRSQASSRGKDIMATNRPIRLLHTLRQTAEEEPTLYVFGNEDSEGYVVIAGDDVATVPVLGYSKTGTFDAGIIPDNLRYWLDEYGRQLAFARQNPSSIKASPSNNSREAISPLITSKWDQGAPYNNLCPIDPNTGLRSDAGCVPIALAQIMNYHKWPEQGVGSHSYEWEGETLTADFGATTYQWDQMKDTYTVDDEDPNNAVATLIYHCGVATEVYYSSNGTAHWGYTSEYKSTYYDALTNYFNYSKSATTSSFEGSFTEHDDIIYNELQAKRPVLIGGGTHMFVCDGYDNGFYHFNFGWSGYCDDYFLLSAINPINIDYSNAQEIVYGIRKPGDRQTIDGVRYELYEDGTALLVEGPVEGASGEYTIPSSVQMNGKNYEVTAIGNEAFVHCDMSSVTSIIIPNSITSIGWGAFNRCGNLRSVSIPNSITKIGNHAFEYCSQLTSVTIPDNVTSIGYAAFKGSNLTSIVIPNTVKHIGGEAFANCSSLTSVTILNSDTEIGRDAFQNCSGLTTPVYTSTSFVYMPRSYNGEYIIPNGITTICASAFSDCNGLTSLTIPNSVTCIEVAAFRNCSGLTSLTIPSSVISIGVDACFGCSGLTSIQVESGNTVYDSREECNAIIETASNTLIAGCNGSFIPNGIQSIGNDAFRGYKELTSVIIPNSVTAIGFDAFKDCSGLTSLVIPPNVKYILDGTFYGCSGLTSLVIPRSVVGIEANSFSYCSGLTSIQVEEGNAVFDSRNDCNAIIETAYNSLRVGCKNTVIPNNVEAILFNAFKGCSGLTSLTIPNSVTYIDTYAFEDCSGLSSIVLPRKLTSINAGVFYNCSGLASVTIPKNVTSIGWGAFQGCCSLNEIYCKAITPPVIDQETFLTNQIPHTLYIPVGSKEEYEGTAIWDGFAEIFEMNFNDPVVIDGDVTGNGSVDVQDATIVVNYILGKENSNEYDYSLADINNDGKINVFDVTAIINIILSNGGNSATARSLTRQDELWESVCMTTDGDELLFGIANPDRFTSFQFDVELPQGVDLLDVGWNGKTDHVLQFAKNCENKYTVVALSMASTPLPILNDALLRLRLSDATGETVRVDNVLFVTPDGKAARFNGAGIGMATGVQDISFSQSELIYDISGRQLNMKREQLGKGIYIINNKKVVIK